MSAARPYSYTFGHDEAVVSSFLERLPFQMTHFPQPGFVEGKGAEKETWRGYGKKQEG